MNQHTVKNINILSDFLAYSGVEPAVDLPNTVYVLAGNAVLFTTQTLFTHLSSWTTPTTLVIAGGIGHSTSFLYDAVDQHPEFSPLATTERFREKNLPEARVLERILLNYCPDLAARVKCGTLTLLIDDKSTNCGQNALFSKQLIDARNQEVDRIVLVQDPTMSRRTLAGLDKYYTEDSKHPKPQLMAWPTFIPRMLLDLRAGGLQWAPVSTTKNTVQPQLWSHQRFFDLLMGEIPRLRDDTDGYGPNGKGFIGHVEIPDEVEEAYAELRTVLLASR